MLPFGDIRGVPKVLFVQIVPPSNQPKVMDDNSSNASATGHDQDIVVDPSVIRAHINDGQGVRIHEG